MEASNNTRIPIIFIIGVFILLVPFVAMQFTDQVQWPLSDFVVAGFLLLGTGIVVELTLRNAKSQKQRIILVTIVILIFLLIWAELAVGIFGSPFAGS